jgi:hypothetical protein
MRLVTPKHDRSQGFSGFFETTESGRELTVIASFRPGSGFVFWVTEKTFCAISAFRRSC